MSVMPGIHSFTGNTMLPGYIILLEIVLPGYIVLLESIARIHSITGNCCQDT